MKIFPPGSLAILLLTSLIAPGALSAETQQPETYQIEILVFENTERLGVDAERWPDIPDDIADDSTALSVDDAEEDVFMRLPDNSLKLGGARNKLDKSPNYRVLYHKGWKQQVVEKDQTTPALITEEGLLEGKVQMYKRRFLHVNADLIYNSYEGKVRLKERRRLNSKELHYFDHPLFGMLIRVEKSKKN